MAPSVAPRPPPVIRSRLLCRAKRLLYDVVTSFIASLSDSASESALDSDSGSSSVSGLASCSESSPSKMNTVVFYENSSETPVDKHGISTSTDVCNAGQHN